MLATKVLCPHCSRRLKTTRPLEVGRYVLCPRCDRSFAVRPEWVTARAEMPVVAAVTGAHSVPPPVSGAQPPVPDSVRRWALAVLVLFFLTALSAIGLAFYLSR
jgi:hypothetical protein